MPLNLQPGFYPDVSEKDYHADNLCDVPTLSCSLAKVLIEKSPLHAWCQHPRLGNKVHRESTPEQELGSASHKKILGKGADVAIFTGDSWRGNEAKGFRAEARAAGRIPVLAEDVTALEQQRIRFREQLAERGLLKFFDEATPEVVIVYDDGPRRCRAMLDKLYIDEVAKRAIIFDVKNCGSANPGGLGRLVFNQHYDMQECSYKRAVEILRPDLAGRVEFKFGFVEESFPFALTVAELDGESHSLGQSKWSRAWQMWHECLTADQWPGYSKTVARLEPPAFGLAAEIAANPILP